MSEGRERMPGRLGMSECTERSEGRERMPGRLGMSECTERGEGRDRRRREGTA